ncbi:glycosyltransferase family 4 protein [Thaumasiovibrio subtropicus]|uniref:glycosyltransferase family 4 protein n=2 Tax=Thaumasiovibrio subtropicus TaxID=1891207 RepID=UPI001C84AFE6|nr:glycosyltransferase family 4 protein [Thaumasiovibrio subtropicus]
MKILYCCSTLERTGPTSQLFNIVTGVINSRSEVIVVTLSSEKENSLKDKFEKAGVNVVCLDEAGVLGIKGLSQRLLGLINDGAIECVHTQGIRSDMIMSLLTNKVSVRWISTLRNIPYLDYPAQYGKFKGWVMAVTHILALQRCKNLVVVSHSLKKPLQRFFRRNINVVPNGIDTEFYSNTNTPLDEIATIRHEIQLSPDDRVLVYTGVLEERKNLVSILNSIDKLDGFRLLLVGDGSLADELASHPATKIGKAVLVGAVSDVRPYILMADAFLLLSKAEGLPNSALESLSLGCPVILSDIGPHQEIKEKANNCAQLIDLAEDEGLTDFLKVRYDDWIRGLSQGECREIADYSFSARVNSNAYQELYRLGKS